MTTDERIEALEKRIEALEMRLRAEGARQEPQALPPRWSALASHGRPRWLLDTEGGAW